MIGRLPCALRRRLERGAASTRRGAFIPAIQGLRGVSAVSVLAVHVWLMARHAGMIPWPLPAWLEVGLPTLGQGVSLFFIISGFLIPASLVRHGSTGRFLLDRALRIMPLFLLLHAAVFVLGPLIGYKEFRGMAVGDYIATLFANLFFLAPLTGHFLAQQNSWTLTYEWGFYIVTALGFAGLAAPRRRWLTALVAAAAVAAAVASPLVLFFAVGAAFAVLDARLRLPRGLGWPVWAAALVGFFYTSQYVGVAIALPLGALVYGVLLDPGSGPARLLSSPAFQYLGKISYSLYLIHPFALFPFTLLLPKLAARGADPELLILAYLSVAPVAVMAASTISHRLVEVRARQWISAWFDGAAAPGPRRGATLAAREPPCAPRPAATRR